MDGTARSFWRGVAFALIVVGCGRVGFEARTFSSAPDARGDVVDAARPEVDASAARLDLAPFLAEGWTPVFSSSFDEDSPAFAGVPTSTCGDFGSILGGVGLLGRDDRVELPLSLPPHTELRVVYDFVAVDSWDDEVVFLEVDGGRVHSFRCGKRTDTLCNRTSDQCGRQLTEPNDGKQRVDVRLPHGTPNARITFGAELDQGRMDESWGLDDVVVLVR